MKYGPRANLVRDLTALHNAMEQCHAKYRVLTSTPEENSEAYANAKADHLSETKELLDSLSRIENTMKIHAPKGTWESLNDYGGLEAIVHPKSFGKMADDAILDQGSGDYESAIESLREYIRANLKPEEVHKHE